ncbi:hypothetical protein ZIOFF_019439 [Zingiber officinale]|uniref:ubiquitinyl hydrolase 1 n=1 Tax=Zingiber officinale TaxID=94328 RepID=A0A8J5LJ94_ZINOF|nr:hypothetical protein ZIOFF_019439 [Zingiber officinale]
MGAHEREGCRRDGGTRKRRLPSGGSHASGRKCEVVVGWPLRIARENAEEKNVIVMPQIASSLRQTSSSHRIAATYLHRIAAAYLHFILLDSHTRPCKGAAAGAHVATASIYRRIAAYLGLAELQALTSHTHHHYSLISAQRLPVAMVRGVERHSASCASASRPSTFPRSRIDFEMDSTSQKQTVILDDELESAKHDKGSIKSIRTWMKYINPDVACISRNTLVSDINQIYLKEKEKLKYVLTTIQNREMMAYESQTITSVGKSQLDLYLEEPKLEFAYYQDLDILDHWKNQKHRYPTLALMACDVLAIPTTTIASESAFSIGARVLTKYRSCTFHEKVQALICTRNWLHGYAIDKDNEGNASIKTTFSKQESNTLEDDINEEKGGEGGSEEIDVDDVIDEI